MRRTSFFPALFGREGFEYKLGNQTTDKPDTFLWCRLCSTRRRTSNFQVCELDFFCGRCFPLPLEYMLVRN